MYHIPHLKTHFTPLPLCAKSKMFCCLNYTIHICALFICACYFTNSSNANFVSILFAYRCYACCTTICNIMLHYTLIFHNYFPPFCERHRWGYETLSLLFAFQFYSPSEKFRRLFYCLSKFFVLTAVDLMSTKHGFMPVSVSPIQTAEPITNKLVSLPFPKD